MTYYVTTVAKDLVIWHPCAITTIDLSLSSDCNDVKSTLFLLYRPQPSYFMI